LRLHFFIQENRAMKKILIGLLGIGLLGANVLAQSRPTVVVSPSPTPQQGKRPPVLIGDTTRQNPAPSPTPPVAGEEPAIEDDEVIRVETNLVTLPVTVLDRDGRFISGLRKEDFQVFEDNAPQKIEEFASVEQPFTVVLMIDVSPSTQYQISEIQDAAIAFVNQLRRDDRVVVIAFDEKVRVLSPVTSNRAVLRNAIMQTDFGNGTSLYEAVEYALNAQLRQIEGRKAVVLFTDGVDTTSRRISYQNSLGDAEESEALIYPIRYDTYQDMAGGNSGGGYPYPQRRRGVTLGDILGGILGGGVTIGGSQGGGTAGGSREDYERGRRYLHDLARLSGGRIFEANNNLNAAFSGIAEELRRQYTIGYYPENAGQSGQRKQIRVRVNRPNAVVRTKNSYIVGNGSAPTGNTATRQPQQPQPKKTPPKILNRLPF
jgi:Ca-activated chloride channel homolog